MLVLTYAWSLITGLNASLMGALWPVMYLDFDVALSAVGVFSWIGSIVGLIANLSAGWILRRFGASKVTTICGCVMAVSLFGYTLSGEFWMLCLFSIPSGVAAGIIAVAMNNYVALHYPSRHMSWVHCMWGVGSIIGPNIVSFGLARGFSWHLGYRFVFAAWVFWTIVLLVIRKCWKPDPADGVSDEKRVSMSLGRLIRVRGVKEVVLTCFCYNAVEQGMMMWMSSYMVIYCGMIEEMAATYASLFFLGITAGRMLNGFLTVRFSDDQLIRFGEVSAAVGAVVLLLPFGRIVTLCGLLLIGFGCAPVCPCLLHSTPQHFGQEHSQALVGVQVAASTLGNCILPSMFGLIANYVSIALLPVYVLICLGVMAFAHHRMVKLTA